MSRLKITAFLEYLLISWIIFEYFTIYMRFLSYETIYTIGFAILIPLLVISHKKSNVKIITAPFIFYLLIILILTLYNKRLLLYSVLYLGYLPLCYIYFRTSKVYNNHTFGIEWLKKYCNIITIIALISLIFWIGTNIFNIFTPTSYIPSNWGENASFIPSYYYLYFETQTTFFAGYELQRNTAIFTEAPVCNLLYCFALTIEIFLTNKKSLIRKIILITAIITTFSTTGQMFLILILFIYIIFYIPSKSKIRKLLLFSLPFLLYIAYTTATFIIQDKSASSSYEDRQEHISEMINLGMKNPIGGIGVMTYDKGISNSIFHLFAEGGILLFIIYFYFLLVIPFNYFKRQKDIRWILTNGLFFFLFIFTVAYYKSLDLTLIAYSLANIDKKHLSIN